MLGKGRGVRSWADYWGWWYQEGTDLEGGYNVEYTTWRRRRG